MVDFCNSSAVGAETGGHQSLMASQPSPLVEFQVRERTCLRKQGEWLLRTDT